MARDQAAPGGPRQPEPAAVTDVLITIRALAPTLAPVEKRVAEAVLADPLGTAMQSISELAASCGTS
ncbi:MAG TPA: RpiR family transcriptional regulator, partial [Streptosporangiaceae bacterium]|nr:RpiR family transcriptional regulator [Streptosporangiaceae bacterium]